MTNANIHLGDVTLPSGLLDIYDVGITALVLAGHVPEVPVVAVPGLPTDRVLEVLAAPITGGDWAGHWDHVLLQISAGHVVRSEQVGEVIVDFARVLFIDRAARANWNHQESIDGLADFVFWGRDAAALAEAVGAPPLAVDQGSYGWVNTALEDAIAYGKRAEAAREARGFKLATDFRPHSHHWQALEQVRSSPHEAGVIEVAGSRACLWMTSWGDGVFPVFRDFDESGALLQVRVQLSHDETEPS